METAKYSKEYTIKFDGADIQDHAMPLNLFVSQLETFTKITNEVQKKLLKKNERASIKIKSNIRPGSVELDILYTVYAAVLHLTPEIVKYAPDVIKTVIEFINLKKFLRGEKPKEVYKNEDNSMKIINTYGESNIVNADTYNFFINNSTVNTGLDALIKPIQEGKLFKVAITEKPDPKDEKKEKPLERVQILPTDIKSLRYIPQDVPPEVTEEIKTVELITAQLNGEADKWRFIDLEQDMSFTADIVDEEFLQKITDKKVQFNNGMLFEVQMQTTTNHTGKRTMKSREILKVLSVE